MSDPSNLPPLPANHLNHPENWTTGSEPITSNQEGFIKVLEGQKPDLVPEAGLDTSKLSKSDASDVIDKLKKGEKLGDSVNDAENHVESGGKPAAASSSGKEDTSASTKRKAPAADEADKPASMEAAAEEEGTGESISTGSTSATGEVKSKASSSKKPADDDTIHKAKKAKKDGEADPIEEAIVAKAEGETKEDPIEVDTPPTEQIATPAEPADGEKATTANGGTNGAKAANGGAKKGEETTPGDEAHLDHPENWATGDQPATDKQKGFLKVLEKQKGAEGAAGDVEHLGKSEASEKIDELKNM